MDLLEKDIVRNGKGIESTHVFLFMLSKGSVDYHTDPMNILQLGLAMLLDKPIAVIVIGDDVTVPENLKKVAFCIVNVNEASSVETAAKKIIRQAQSMGYVSQKGFT